MLLVAVGGLDDEEVGVSHEPRGEVCRLDRQVALVEAADVAGDHDPLVARLDGQPCRTEDVAGLKEREAEVTDVEAAVVATGLDLVLGLFDLGPPVVRRDCSVGFDRLLELAVKPSDQVFVASARRISPALEATVRICAMSWRNLRSLSIHSL